MAKIITQTRLFDYREIEQLGDLERFSLALEGIEDEALMCLLETQRGCGRNDYPVRAIWNALICMKVFGHSTVESLRREMMRNSQLRQICGFSEDGKRKHLVPPARVFSNFIKGLKRCLAQLEKIFTGQVNQLYQLLPEFGKDLAGDGKYLDSHANGKSKRPEKDCDGRTERDAAYSVKEYRCTGKDGKEHTKKETHYGFRAHVICDVKTELPIGFSVLAANYDEKKAMSELLKTFDEEQKRRAETLSLDRGYDSTEMIRQIKGTGICPVVDIRNCWKDGEGTKQYKNTDMVYDYCGNVYWVDDFGKQHKMVYEGYDKQRNCLRYSHNGKTHRICIRYDERVFLPIARDSHKFKRIYKGRTAVERLNGRLDRDYKFEDHCIRGLGKMQLFTTISLLIMNGMAIGKLRQGANAGLAALTKLPHPKNERSPSRPKAA